MMTDEKLYTTREVADKFGVHMGTVRRWVRQGILSGRKFNKRLYYTEDDLREFANKAFEDLGTIRGPKPEGTARGKQ